jgi:putative polyketide hydroxylase
MNDTRVPVLIVGAGAAGLTTSAVLTKHGTRSLLVEKRREVSTYPKARNLSFRSLEILRGLGLADEVHAVAEGISAMVVKPALNSAEETAVPDFHEIFAAFNDMSPEPGAQYCPQSRFEPMLLAYTRGHGNEVRYGTELLSFEQVDSGITAVLRHLDSGQTETVRADYLVGADSVHSPIRRALGVTTSGYGALPMYLVFVYFRAPWRKFVPDLADGDVVQVKNADVDALFIAAEGDLGLFATTYFPRHGEAAAQFTPDRCRKLILAAVGERIDVQIVEVTPWQPHERVADQFQSGRVFLVGDSAHTMPPFKAGGATVAIQSAHNLAWKLAAVADGVAEPGLLATYHAERHPIGRFSARQSLTGPPVAFLRTEDNAPALPVEQEAPIFALLAGYQYRSTAVVTDDPRPADPDAVLFVDELRGQPGTRVPHVWVHRGGQRVSTLDLLGSGFSLLTRDAGIPWAAAAASVSGQLGVPISVHCIGPRADVIDPEDRWASLTGLAPDGALLVRPDDFVGWRAAKLPAHPVDGLRQALSSILSRESRD